jgi:8-oxo-dGTP diphosphatase
MGSRAAVYPGVVTAEAPGISQVTRVAAYAVCIDAGRILLARWVGPDRKHWTMPGGGVEHGEDPFHAVIRETLEETGYAIAIESLLGIDSVHRRHPPSGGGREVDFHGIRIIYAASVVAGSLRHEIGGSTDQAAWVDLDKVAGLDHVDLVNVALDLHRIRPASGWLPGEARKTAT